MQVTIKDIAKKAKVSTSAVSLALNNRKGISEKTRKRILRLAEKMNYRPNLTARSLISKHSYTLGYVLTNITDPFYSEVLLGIERQANELGYQVMIANTGGSMEREGAVIDMMLARGVDGIVFSTVTVDDPNLTRLMEMKFPLITINRVAANHPEVAKMDSVSIDSYNGAYQVGEHLYKLGHDNVALVTGSLNTYTSLERSRGFKQAMANHGLEVPARNVFVCDWDFKKAYAAANSIIKLKPRPSAVFTYDDNMALAVREAALEQGLRVPEDLALVGWDDIRFTALRGIELTTINQKKYDMGAISAKILINKIDQEELGMVNKVVMEAELKVRRSCGFKLRGYIR